MKVYETAKMRILTTHQHLCSLWEGVRCNIGEATTCMNYVFVKHKATGISQADGCEVTRCDITFSEKSQTAEITILT